MGFGLLGAPFGLDVCGALVSGLFFMLKRHLSDVVNQNLQVFSMTKVFYHLLVVVIVFKLH